MLKRWATWPRGTRWLAGIIATVVLTLAVAWALFVPIADWLAHHDVGSATGTLHETALDDARGRLLTLGAGLFAAGALVFTARNSILSQRTVELAEQGQVTDRYTKAIEQLGSDKLDVRIGGIYALERVARDSARDHPAVMEVLTAFIREHSREPWPLPGPDGEQRERSTRPDVQAAITVIARRDQKRDIRPNDLIGANLAGADLAGANLTRANLTDTLLTGANLTGANLTGAKLRGADLTRANLIRADLTDASLTDANLTGAYLDGAKLRGAGLIRANLTDASLGGAHLTRAFLTDANLTRAKLDGSDLTRANLIRANLTDASLAGADLGGADLTVADLTGAYLAGADLGGAGWPRRARVPEGWKRDTRSGRLKPVGSGAEPADTN